MPLPPPLAALSRVLRHRSLLLGLTCYLVTAVLIVGAAAFAHRFVSPSPKQSWGGQLSLLESFVVWDGSWYHGIVERGYAYSSSEQSNTAFFPAYPLLARGVMLLGINANLALLVVSHGCLVAALCLLHRYTKERRLLPTDDEADLATVAFALFPTTFYYRMAYSESLFVLLALLAMWMMQRRRSPWWIALVIGAATGSRPVGVALLLPFYWHLYETSRSPKAALMTAVGVAPIAVWGLLAYIGYQAVVFENPFTFVATQGHWTIAIAPPWAVYDSGSPCCWWNKTPETFLPLNIWFANPIYFLIFAALIGFGTWAGWLDRRESLLSAGLLLIPFILQGFRFCMGSQGRFASVAFPAYLVMARGLAALPSGWIGLLFAVCGCLMAGYAALFVRLYELY